MSPPPAMMSMPAFPQCHLNNDIKLGDFCQSDGWKWNLRVFLISGRLCMNKVEDFFKSLKVIYVSYLLMASGFASYKGLSNSKVNQKPFYVFFCRFYGFIMYPLVHGTGSFSCHFLSGEHLAGSWKAWGLGRDELPMEPSRCWAPIPFSSARSLSQQSLHLPPSSAPVSWAGTGGPELRRPLPCLRSEMSTRPDQDSRYRTKAVGSGEGEGDSGGSV